MQDHSVDDSLIDRLVEGNVRVIALDGPCTVELGHLTLSSKVNLDRQVYVKVTRVTHDGNRTLLEIE
jgi:hypothetical protein